MLKAGVYGHALVIDRASEAAGARVAGTMARSSSDMSVPYFEIAMVVQLSSPRFVCCFLWGVSLMGIKTHHSHARGVEGGEGASLRLTPATNWFHWRH